MLRLATCLLALLVGCASLPPPKKDEPVSSWCRQERPAHVVVSDAVPDQCAVAVCDAVQWWALQGANYVTCAVVPAQNLTPNYPMPRFIQVVAGPLEDVGDSGEARLHHITPECIDAAEIRLDPYFCAPEFNTSAHELGHALGLDHVLDPSNLMFPATLDSPRGLTQEQLDHVR